VKYKDKLLKWKQERQQLLAERKLLSVPELARKHRVSESWINKRLEKAYRDENNTTVQN
jgi:hypothetical protein